MCRKSPRTRSRSRSRSRSRVPAPSAPAAVPTSKSPTPPEPLSKLSQLGGLNQYKLFGVSESWVDLSLPPGMSSLAPIYSLPETLKSIRNLDYFIFSPNLTWFLMSLLYYVLFPYQTNTAPTLATTRSRLLINTALCGAYTGFFYVSLYVNSWGTRKFFPNSVPLPANMRHNIWYWFLGVAMWTVMEAGMEKIYSSPATPTPPTLATILDSPTLLLINVATVLLIPLWRDIHFYSAHRFLHLRPLYRLVHSLHHRNTDPEPFSGLAMHPVEHLYYYSNAFFPTVYFLPYLSPLLFHFLFLHLTFAPAAGHSGFDDHFGSDQYHAIHHAKFEANYGSPSSAFLDRYFGTFRETLGKSKEYTGEWKETKESGKKGAAAKKVWSANGRLGLYDSLSQAFYDCLNLGIAAATVYVIGAGRVDESTARALAAGVATLPIVLALLVNVLVSRDKLSQFWPFHKEKYGLLFTLITGVLFCVVPLYKFVFLCATV